MILLDECVCVWNVFQINSVSHLRIKSNFYIVCDSATTADKIISDVPLFYHAEFKNHEENIFFYFFTSKWLHRLSLGT